MKRKNDSEDEVVTRGILRTELKRELSNYPTKSDLRKELSNYPTKSDLRKELSNYPTKSDLREALKNHPMRDEFKEYRSEMLTKLDEIVGVLAQIREDQLFMNHDISGLKQSDADLDVRIKRLESYRTSGN